MKNKKNIFIALGTVAFLGVLYFGYEYFMYVSTDNAQVEAHSLMMAAKVGGYVKAVNVTEGQKVNKGEVLVEIDPRDYQNTVLQAKGAYRKPIERQFSFAIIEQVVCAEVDAPDT